jgi:transposase, IS30 family
LPVAGRDRGFVPKRLDESVRSGRFLSLLERRRIDTLRGRSWVCALSWPRSSQPSTISRELCRNARVHNRGRYDADLTHARTREPL